MDMQAFYTGRAFDIYEFFGAHTYFGGTHFAVWAPSARQIQLVLTDAETKAEIGIYDMCRNYNGMGGAVWGLDAAGVNSGTCYQYRITGADGSVVDHCDPCGRAMALRPDGRSVITDPLTDAFTDEKWMSARNKNFDAPLNIYELQVGSWRRRPTPAAANTTETEEDKGTPYTYAELAELLPQYVKEKGYTHIELMPLAEYPFDGSWGYQTTGFYAPSSRYGTPADLCKLVNACHANGIGVILDFVPVHFAVDDYGLKHFDGTALYEYPSNDVGESEWGSCNFMHSRGEIRCYLQSCANYWLTEYHIDGLRMDAVSRLLYWQGDPKRGVNGTTVEFLKNMNAGLQQRHPTVMLIAEDSTNYPQVTAPVQYGGLGFDYKWDLGWMNDTLDYFKKTAEERKANLGKLTFSMMYFWNEHYILPFSHDENVHGKATILQKMYGEYADKFPQGRALYMYMAIHPGKMLDFMGNEFGQLREYDESREQDWNVLKYPLHDAFANYRAALNTCYNKQDAFWQGEYNPANFEWLDCSHPELDACAILRRGAKSTVAAMFNFGDTVLENYELKLPAAGKMKLLLDSDWDCWGGTTPKPTATKAVTVKNTVTLTLPRYSGRLYLLEMKPVKQAEKTK